MYCILLFKRGIADGNLLFRDMYNNRNGSISYNWKDNETASAREMIAPYAVFEPWDINFEKRS